MRVKEICRKYGISDATRHNWKSRYGAMNASELKRLKETGAELPRYKKMYAELARENCALKDLLEKKLRGHGRSAKRRNTWWPDTDSAEPARARP